MHQTNKAVGSRLEINTPNGCIKPARQPYSVVEISRAIGGLGVLTGWTPPLQSEPTLALQRGAAGKRRAPRWCPTDGVGIPGNYAMNRMDQIDRLDELVDRGSIAVDIPAPVLPYVPKQRSIDIQIADLTDP